MCVPKIHITLLYNNIIIHSTRYLHIIIYMYAYTLYNTNSCIHNYYTYICKTHCTRCTNAACIDLTSCVLLGSWKVLGSVGLTLNVKDTFLGSSGGVIAQHSSPKLSLTYTKYMYHIHVHVHVRTFVHVAGNFCG